MGTEAVREKNRYAATLRAGCLQLAEPPGVRNIGGARRDRTADLNTASVALSQLSYGPEPSRLY